MSAASTPGCSTELCSRAGRSRTYLEPRIRRLPGRSATTRISAPCTGIEPVSPVRQTGWHASFITGQTRAPGGSRTRLSGVASRCLDRSATGASVTPTGRAEGGEPSAPALEIGCSSRSTPLTISGRDRTRTCKGFRLARLPTGCHHASWLALPSGTVPAGLEPATLWLTASRTTFVLRDNQSNSSGGWG